MQLGSAGNTANTTLRGLTRRLLLTTSTSDPFTDALIDGWLNHYYHEIADIVLRLISDSWVINGNTEQKNLISGTNQYALTASDILGLRRVEIDYVGSTSTFEVAKPINEQNIRQSIKNVSTTWNLPQATKSNPIYRMVTTATIEIHPMPDTAVTNGLYVEYEDELTELSATTDSPTLIVTAFHKILSYGAAMTIAEGKQSDRFITLEKKYINLFNLLIEWYGKRLKNKPTAITPLTRRYI